jgi:glyoxylase-like metal-dependent hydrolase (beta-lactamase superfamily II)
MSSWHEIADGVFVGRYDFFDQTIGLVLGDGACLVLDTRTTSAQADELREDIRRITPHPPTVLNTHHHFDHSFGNARFRLAEIWGHERCARTLRDEGEEMRARVRERMPELADELAEVEIDPPTTTVGDDGGTIAVGGRSVEVRYLGLGHTDNDLVTVVPDAGVTFAGDLIEQGAPPSFGDAYPLDWPATNRRMLQELAGDGPVVPGHGEVTDRAFVEAQTRELEIAARVAREAFDAGRPLEDVVGDVPFPEPYGRECLQRAYRQLEAGARGGP